MTAGAIVRWGCMVLGAALLAGGLARYSATQPPNLSGGILATIGFFVLLLSIALHFVHNEFAAPSPTRGHQGQERVVLSAGMIVLTLGIAGVATTTKLQSTWCTRRSTRSAHQNVAGDTERCRSHRLLPTRGWL